MEKHVRLPSCLFESIEEICWRQDNKFIEDVAKIIGKPAGELKKRILGVRGTSSVIICDASPWWVGRQCPIMTLCDGKLWKRCGSACESNGTCYKHRNSKNMHYDNPYFENLEKREPFIYNDETVWVAKDGSVMTDGGVILKKVRINTTNGLATELSDGM